MQNVSFYYYIEHNVIMASVVLLSVVSLFIVSLLVVTANVVTTNVVAPSTISAAFLLQFQHHLVPIVQKPSFSFFPLTAAK